MAFRYFLNRMHPQDTERVMVISVYDLFIRYEEIVAFIRIYISFYSSFNTRFFNI